MYDLGDTAGLAIDVKDATGALVNATSVTLTITQPDNTNVTPAVANPPTTTGHYTVDFVPTQAGRHLVRWVTTGPDTAFTDILDVRPAAQPLLVSLKDAREHLGTASKDDEEVRAWLESATAIVEATVGPVVRRTVTEWGRGGRAIVVTGEAPVISVTSIKDTRGTVLVDGPDLDLDQETGEVWRNDGGCLPAGRWRITYDAGRLVVPSAMPDAAKIILKQLWETQRGSGRHPKMFGAGSEGARQLGSEEAGFVYMGFATPKRAIELLRPYRMPVAG